MIDRKYYYLAKAIAEEFDYHVNYRLDDLNTKAINKDEHWSVSGHYVHFNLKYNKVEIVTEYFNEFDEHCPKIIYSFISGFGDKDCRTFKDYGEIVGAYFKHFQDDFPAYFATIEY